MHWHKREGWDSQEAREAGALPPARAIHRLSWGTGDRLPKATAKGEGVRVATGAPHRRVAHRDAVKLNLTKRPRRKGKQPAEATKASKRSYIRKAFTPHGL